MLPIDRIRFHLLAARERGDERETVALMADALIEERRATGSAGRGDLIARYGFTADEVDRLGGAGLDRATTRFVGNAMADPVAA